ncbi:MAG TPA: hypothetical protein VEB59_11580 [Gemmatimonadales bacterium]|nr:hypothetical protein [Gemmatimonadales bacterium]
MDWPDRGSGGEQSNLEREVEASRDRLKDRQREAEASIEDAERLAAKAKELEEREERLRRAIHEPTGPLLPPAEPAAD